MDETLELKRAPDQRLQEQNDRLQLLLKLTNSITSNLELKDVLRGIAANVREVMRCDAATILLPGAEPGTFRNHAVDFPGSKGFLREQQIVTPGEDSPPRRAFETLKPVISTNPVEWSSVQPRTQDSHPGRPQDRLLHTAREPRPRARTSWCWHARPRTRSQEKMSSFSARLRVRSPSPSRTRWRTKRSLS